MGHCWRGPKTAKFPLKKRHFHARCTFSVREHVMALTDQNPTSPPPLRCVDTAFPRSACP